MQPGFGRTGADFWGGHERIGLVPDIVTMGKPMGNGHPVAAVVARPDVLAAFRNTFSYFNTFGGNPVSAAAASAVLDVLEEEGLMQSAHEVGTHALTQLRQLNHPLIADVRGGAGMFMAVEFAEGSDLTPPASAFVKDLVEELRARGVLTSSMGRHNHILKIRPPPLCFSREQADLLTGTLDAALKALPA